MKNKITIFLVFISILLIVGFVVYPKIKRNNEIKRHLELGFKMIEESEYDKAFSTFNKVLQIDGSESKAYYGKGLLYKKYGKYEKAIVVFDRAIEIDSSNVDYYLGRSVVRFELKNFEGAFEDYNKSFLLGNAKIKPIIRSEVSAIEMDFFRQVRDDLESINETLSKTMNTSFKKGLNYILLNDYEKAISEFDIVISNKSTIPNDPEAYVVCHSYKYRGWAKYKLGQYKSAVDDFDDTRHEVWHDGYFIYTLYSEGLSKMEMNDFDGAISDFTKIIDIDFYNSCGVYTKRGQVKLKKGLKKSACLDFKKAVELGGKEAKELLKTNCN